MRPRIRRLRLMEWLCASIILALGLHLLVFPAVFERSYMAGVAAIASYQFWTALLLVVGSARIVALLVNGHWAGGTPQIRLIGNVLGTLIFGMFAGAYFEVTAGPAPSVAIPIFVLLMVADVVSAGFAAADVIHARRALT